MYKNIAKTLLISLMLSATYTPSMQASGYGIDLRPLVAIIAWAIPQACGLTYLACKRPATLGKVVLAFSPTLLAGTLVAGGFASKRLGF